MRNNQHRKNRRNGLPTSTKPGKPINLNKPSGKAITKADGTTTVRYLPKDVIAARHNLSKQIAAQKRKSARARIFGRRLPMLMPVEELGAQHAPEAADRDLGSLWACKTAKAIKRRMAKSDKSFRSKAMRAIERRSISEETRQLIEAILKGDMVTSAPIMTSSQVVREARSFLAKKLIEIAASDPEIEMGMVTIISGDHATSVNRPFIDIANAQAQMGRTLNAMSKDYFAVEEWSLFNSHTHSDGGQLIQGHCHALIFGRGILAKASQVGAKHSALHSSNVTDADPIVIRRVRTDPVNIRRAASYLVKYPHKAKTWCPEREGKKGHMHEGEKGDRYTRFLRMAEILSLVTLEDLVFAGGRGQKEIKSPLVKLIRALCETHARGSTRLIHPDGMATIWARLAKELGKTAWSVPIIARRK
ncbi:hypothetical protein ACOYW6_09540 [Parablastomonas sp. CN1-191]|uniref:hypothetical protein n=1 Tax=Parablastomonas sp. CN1-191 TaxID=3400908 RepID=UPI003BF79B7D